MTKEKNRPMNTTTEVNPILKRFCATQIFDATGSVFLIQKKLRLESAKIPLDTFDAPEALGKIADAFEHLERAFQALGDAQISIGSLIASHLTGHGRLRERRIMNRFGIEVGANLNASGFKHGMDSIKREMSKFSTDVVGKYFGVETVKFFAHASLILSRR
jgi:hypothetical protein